MFKVLMAVPLLVAAIATPAFAEGPMVGVSIGGAVVGPPTLSTGALNTNLQWTSDVTVRGPVLGDYSEGTIGLLNRSQALTLDQARVFETSSLLLGLGAHLSSFHVGVEGEVAFLHEIVQNGGGTLAFHNGAGLILGPYVGVTLPFLHSEFSAIDLSLHYPVLTWLDDQPGPRLMLTLWLGAPAKGTADDDSDDDGTDGDGKPMEQPAPKPKGTDGGLKSQDHATEVKPDGVAPKAAPKTPVKKP